MCMNIFCVYTWKVWVFDHFTNKYSRFGCVYRKPDALDKFIEFKAESNNLLGKHIKALQLDQGGVSSRFNSFHMEHGIIYQLCALGTVLNGLMEKRYRTLINIVILMIGFSLHPIFFGDIS